MYILASSTNPLFACARVGLTSFLLILYSGLSLWAADQQKAEMMINNVCSTCHKITGEGESRFNLKAPDLM